MFREMRRPKQLIALEECQEILASQKRGTLSVLGDDGYPYGLPLDFVYLPSVGQLGSIFFHSARQGHKLDAIAAHDKASFCVTDDGVLEEGSWWYHMRSVICFGRASLVEDPQLLHDAFLALGQKYFPPEYDIEEDIAKSGPRARVIQLRIEHMTGKRVEER